MNQRLWIDKIIHVVHLWRAWDRVSAESLAEEVATYIPNISPYYPGGNCIDLSQRLLEKGDQIIGACLTPCGPISHTAILSDRGIFDPGFRFQKYLPLYPGCEVLNRDGDRFWIKASNSDRIRVGRFVQAYQKESELIFLKKSLGYPDLWQLQRSLLRKRFMNSVVGGANLTFAKFDFTHGLWVSSNGEFSTRDSTRPSLFPLQIWETMSEFEQTVPDIPDFFWEYS